METQAWSLATTSNRYYVKQSSHILTQWHDTSLSTVLGFNILTVALEPFHFLGNMAWIMVYSYYTCKMVYGTTVYNGRIKWSHAHHMWMHQRIQHKATEYELWHQCAAYPGTRTMLNIQQHSMDNIPMLQGNHFYRCPSCMHGKMTRRITIDKGKYSKKRIQELSENPNNSPTHLAPGKCSI